MKVPRFVIDQLSQQPGVNFKKQSLFYLALAYEPRSYSELARKAGMPRGVIRATCKALSSIGWMKIEGSSRMVRPVAVIPPHLQQKMAEMLREQYVVASNKGEFLMKRLLDVWIDNDNFVDNARPEFLVNPLTDQPLEYDRLYIEGVAFEFNGPQHHGPTEMYPDDKASKEAKARDLIKKSLSRDHGVNLVTVAASQLVPDEFEKLLPAELPLNYVDKEGPYFQALAHLCKAYSAKAAARPGVSPPQESAQRQQPATAGTAPKK